MSQESCSTKPTGHRLGKSFLPVVFSGIIVIILVPTWIAGTGSYPLAVVDGNSMNPTLHSGDLVYYAASSKPIVNGTIIIFVQDSNGIPAFNAVTKPVIIHRVIGTGREPDGSLYYETKGDNNNVADPFVTDARDVLGVPVLTMPYAGFPIQFFKTAYGLVAITAFVTLYYMSGVDSKAAESEQRRRLIAVFAKHSLNGEISVRQFERLKMAVEYYQDTLAEELTDPTIVSTIDWLRAGGLDEEWSEEKCHCPSCRHKAFKIESEKSSVLICSHCSDPGRSLSRTKELR